jgi:hypothetical protein
MRAVTGTPGCGKGASAIRPASASGMNRCRFAGERWGPMAEAPAYGQPATAGPVKVGWPE